MRAFTSRTRPRLTPAVVAACGLIAVHAAVAAPVAQLIPVVPGQAGSSQANAINNNGLVVGASGTVAFTYGVAGGLTSLGDFSNGDGATAVAVNDGGTVVVNDAQLQGAALYNGTTVTPLGTFGDKTTGLAINAAGTVVGTTSVQVYDPDNQVYYGQPYAFSRTPGGSTTLSSFYGDGQFTQPSAINAAGTVAGTYTDNASGNTLLYTYTAAGGYVSRGSIAPPTGTGTYVYQANGINASNSVVGTAIVGDQPGAIAVAYVSTPAGFTRLNGLASRNGEAYPGDAANAINDNGVIVGFADVGGFATHAALWLPGSTTAIDLNALFLTLDPADAAVWTLTSATGINRLNDVVGIATNVSGDTRGYILDVSSLVPAVPEPVSLAVVAGIPLLLRRRRQ